MLLKLSCLCPCKPDQMTQDTSICCGEDSSRIEARSCKAVVAKSGAESEKKLPQEH